MTFSQPQQPIESFNQYHPQQGVPSGNKLAPKKKGGCLRWGAIVGGVLFLAAACNAVMGGAENTTSPTSTSSTVAVYTPAQIAQAPSKETTPVENTEVAVVDKPAKDDPASAVPAPAKPLSRQQETPKASAEERSALRKAESYSKMMHMSKAGIYDQLTSHYGEQFSPEAAQYAVENLQADYKKNALEKAKTYLSQMSMSPSAIYDQLTSQYGEQFTAEEAQYAVDNLAP
ncbi:Ltp family lipoprotein [Corynebacterium sp. H127]|uniref:Ltp family lipoprotein n=1 Tax=Corynebacterium sp. H127 TaxID=3133418 RepID=UPI0030997433